MFRSQLVEGQGVIIHMGDDNSAGADGEAKEPFDVRIFVASRLIKQEAMEVFFLDSIFRIHAWHYDFYCRSGEITRPLSIFLRPGIDSWPMDRLRRFDIVILMNDENGERHWCSVAKRYVFPKQVELFPLFEQLHTRSPKKSLPRDKLLRFNFYSSMAILIDLASKGCVKLSAGARD